MGNKTEYETLTLDNGIRCVLERVKSPVLYCGLTIGAGTRDERENEHGMAHFIEHLLFKGTTRRRAYHINSLLDNVGGELNAYTTKEETVVHATALKGDYRKAADLISDVVFNSVFADKDIETERGVIIDEINSYKDTPFESIYDDFEDILFAGSSLGRNILGTKRQISRFRSEDMHAFVGRNYNTDRMVFSVVGDISYKRFSDVATEMFGNVPQHLSGESERILPPYEPRRTVLNKNTYQSHCIIGGRSSSSVSEDRIAVALMTGILGGAGANSRLNRTLRERYGLCYTVEAGFTTYSDVGMVTIYFGCDKENIQRCIDLAYTEISRLKEESLSPRALSMAKRQLLGQLAIASDNSESLMLSAGKSILTHGHIESHSAVKERIEALTADDIRIAAEYTFDDANMSHLIYR